MKKLTVIFTMMLMATSMTLYSQNTTLPLWPDGVPNMQDLGKSEKAVTSGGITRISDVQEPDIAVYLPSGANATGQAVVICPGGGYHILAYNWEGTDIAKWLNSLGIAGIVLKYRLPVDKSNIVSYLSPLMDAKRAIRLVRYHAKAWNIDPGKVGVMGFSAGGHLASTLGTHFDKGDPNAKDPVERESSRPDFMLLGYPVISMADSITHMGSKEALLRSDPSPARVREFSNELQVSDETPPTFLFLAADDQAVPPENSIVFFEALKKHKVPVEMHIYPTGGHGFSLAINISEHTARWTEDAAAWLRWNDDRRSMNDDLLTTNNECCNSN